jgi:hypothetical protein
VTIEAVPGHRNPWWKAIAVNVYEFFSTIDESRPSLVVQNGRGEERKLFNVMTWEEAIERRDQLREELESTGIRAWGARYKVPAPFFDDTHPQSGAQPSS